MKLAKAYFRRKDHHAFCCRVVWKGSFVKRDYDVDKHVSTKMTKYAIKKKVGQLNKNQEIMAKEEEEIIGPLARPRKRHTISG
jgi:hypothetical protein